MTDVPNTVRASNMTDVPNTVRASNMTDVPNTVRASNMTDVPSKRRRREHGRLLLPHASKDDADTATDSNQSTSRRTGASPGNSSGTGGAGGGSNGVNGGSSTTGGDSSVSNGGGSSNAQSGGGSSSSVPFENAKLDHEKVDIRPVKNIKMKQHLCCKHALPKTRLTNAILYENVSHDRHLEMKLSGLQHDKHRTSFTMDLNKRAFVAQQDRKRHKWKREDEFCISSMNLPSFSPEADKFAFSPSGAPTPKLGAIGSSLDRRASVRTIYHMSGAEGRAESAEAGGGRKPLLPMMKIRRERTEIVSHHDKVFVTKLPSVVEVDPRRLHVHNTYCGKALLDRGVPSRDERFRRLHTTLSPAILTGADDYPAENLKSKSRLCKMGPSSTASSDSPAASEPSLGPRLSTARVMVASRGKPKAQGLGDASSSVSASASACNSAPGGGKERSRPALGIDFVTAEKKQDIPDGKDILKLFKSKDIKSLARSLTTDAAGMGMGLCLGLGEGGVREDGQPLDTDRSRTSNAADRRRQQHNVFVPVVDVFYKVKTGS